MGLGVSGLNLAQDTNKHEIGKSLVDHFQK